MRQLWSPPGCRRPQTVLFFGREPLHERWETAVPRLIPLPDLLIAVLLSGCHIGQNGSDPGQGVARSRGLKSASPRRRISAASSSLWARPHPSHPGRSRRAARSRTSIAQPSAGTSAHNRLTLAAPDARRSSSACRAGTVICRLSGALARSASTGIRQYSQCRRCRPVHAPKLALSDEQLGQAVMRTT